MVTSTTTTTTTTNTTTSGLTTSNTCTASSSSVAPRISQTTSTRAGMMANYSYTQNSAHTKVTIYIMKSDLTADNVDILIEPKNVAVKVKSSVGGVSPGNYIFNKILYDEVDPSGATIKYKKDKLQITLKQVKPGEWSELIDKNAKPKTISSSSTAQENKQKGIETETGAPKDPSTTQTQDNKSSIPRPYASHKDWDAIDSQITKELAEDPELKPQGEEALNDLFRNIYKNANEDTRRAMIKSFQTSGGTVLSTNWGEVSEKDYEKERSAPDGMEWKKWKDA